MFKRIQRGYDHDTAAMIDHAIGSALYWHMTGSQKPIVKRVISERCCEAARLSAILLQRERICRYNEFDV